MRLGVLAHALALGAEHDADTLRAHHLRQRLGDVAGQADPPEPRLGDLVEGAGEIDDADPGHRLQRARRGARDGARFGGRVAVLGDEAERAERRRRAQDRADVVRIGDLVEHDQRARVVLALREEVGEPHVLERLDLGDDALVRGIGGDELSQVGDVGVGHRDLGGHVELRGGLPGQPQLAHGTLGIGERGGDRVAAPEARALRGAERGAVAAALHARAPGRGWEKVMASAAMPGPRPAQARQHVVDTRHALRHERASPDRAPLDRWPSG